ncbi:MAG: ABC transporter permease subunit [Roseibium aggregatum]
MGVTFFPTFVFTTAGLRSLPAGSDDLFQVLGVGTFRRLWFLALPSAIPEWSIALRLSAANAILAAIVAEFLMGTSGLGYMFAEARSSLNMVTALGASAVAAAISVAAFLAASAIERWAQTSWR